MKRLRVPRVALIFAIVFAFNIALPGHSRGAQESPARSKQSLTSDERSAIERAVLEDKRVRPL